MKLRVLIVDDEPTARRRLKRFLQKAADVELVAECGDGVNAVAAIREHRPDVVFLDVQMPEMDGFGVLRGLGTERVPVVIFVTAFDQFALRAFEAQALDYLLKPFGEERVLQALERARTFLEGRAKTVFQQQLAGLLRAAAERDKISPRLPVKNNDRVLLLKPREIDWVEADGDYVMLHAGQESHLLRSTLAEMERRLEPEGFVRIHRSRLVNLDRVKEFRPLFQGESLVVLKDGVRLNASQTGMKQLQERLGVAT
jgi:two-component system, LytTR family, response regulator